ncbi:MAG: sugar ABC transporter permease [Oscillospiraceae bacterium]|nr:sugar ABC transporter permease [Oscillospiraceae bacterium]
MQRILNMRPRAAQIWPYLFCIPFLLAYMMFHFFPTLYSFILSFYDWNGIMERSFVGVRNYIDLFTKDTMFLRSLKNTAILMGLSTPITVILGLFLANSLFHIGKGRMAYQTINFFPYITTPVAIGFIFSYMFDWQFGFINQIFIRVGLFGEPYFWLQDPWASRMIVVIMIVWRYLGYYMTLYLAALTALPQDVYEAAKVDGANRFIMFFRITVPLLRNMTIFLLLTSMIGGLQMFEEPLLLFSGWANMGNGAMGGPDNAVLTTVWKFYNDAFRLDSRLGYSSAIAYSLFAIIAAVSFLAYRIARRKGGTE